MCGIAGYIDTGARHDDGVVERQLAQLTHRGPDAEGWFGCHGGGVGETRLSVIHLVSGDPPPTNQDGTIRAVLNGEIYNYRQLQEQLSGFGHRLATACDTEVIAHLAERCDDPVDIASRLHGMFSFAVWDSSKRRLVLGRDRMGKKPLYYWAGGDVL